jgi:uncharacterized protein
MRGFRALVIGALGLLFYGLFEAGWLRRDVVVVEIEGLPAELDGLRIAHLSDFHLGVPSCGRVATARAVAWVAERTPDLVCITGDLISHPRGVPRLIELLDALDEPLVVLGNHDVAVTRDPFSRTAELAGLEGRSTLLRDAATTIELRGRRIQVVGVDPDSHMARTARPSLLADPGADLRILLSHFPGVVRDLPEGAFQLVLAGHLHAGQIVIPYPGGRLTPGHPGARFRTGLYRAGTTTLHISSGTGTTFVPIRFWARPGVTELVLRRPAARVQQSS